MKKILASILVMLFSNAYSQLYRAAFDKGDIASNAGQGCSFCSNASTQLPGCKGVALDGEADIMRSYLIMYRATKDKKYLDKFIIHAKRVQERRDDNIQTITSSAVSWGTLCTQLLSQGLSIPNNTNSQGWSYDILNNVCCGGWQSTVLYSGKIIFPMTDFVYLLKVEEPSLDTEPVPAEAQGFYSYINEGYTVSNYGEFANWLQFRVYQTILYHDDNWSDIMGLYDNTRPTDNQNPIDPNQQCAMGKSLVLMYVASQNDSYYNQPDPHYGNQSARDSWLNKIVHIAALFSVLLNDHGGVSPLPFPSSLGSNPPQSNLGYHFWCGQWSCPSGQKWEDIGHGIEDAMFADLCYRNSILDYNNNPLFTLTDMQKFGNMVAYQLYDGPRKFHMTVYGTNSDCYSACDGDISQNYSLAGYWGFLIPYNPYIYQIISDFWSAAAIYSSDVPLKMAYLAQAQSTNFNFNTGVIPNTNYKFNPIAVNRSFTSIKNWSGAAGGDFDGNGTEEFATVSNNGIAEVYGMDNTNHIVQLAGSLSLPGVWAGAASGNFISSNTRDEFIALNKTSGSIYLFEQNGTAVSTVTTLPSSSSPAWACIAGGNVDGIAGDEAITVRTNGDVHIIKYNGSALTDNFISNMGSSQIAGVAIGDFDGTGNKIAVVNNSTGHIEIYSLSGGVLTLVHQYTATAGGYNLWNGLTAGDFDGDGIDEIIAHRDYDGQFLVYKVKAGVLDNEYGEYFPVDHDNGVMCSFHTENYPDKDALVSLRTFDGQITIFNMDGVCPNLYLNNTTVDDNYTINNPYTNINNNYTVDYHANNTLYVSNFTVEAGSEVNFIAGKKIIVSATAGNSISSAQLGSKFHAYTDDVTWGCGSDTYFRQSSTPSRNKPTPSAPVVFNKEPEISKPAAYLNADISPNPNNGKFTLAIKENTSSELSIYNSLGQIVFQSSITNNQSTIDLSSHPRGIYFLKVQTADPAQNGAGKIYTEKIVLQ